MPQDGPGVPTEKARSCALCGEVANVHGLAIERFGEAFCSEGHAEELVARVREARVQAAAARAFEASTTEIARVEASADAMPKPRDWRRSLKLGACCAVPMLALLVLAGGGGVLLGAAGAILPLLAVLACPLGMYFMMRGMMKMGQAQHPNEQSEKK